MLQIFSRLSRLLPSLVIVLVDLQFRQLLVLLAMLGPQVHVHVHVHAHFDGTGLAHLDNDDCRGAKKAKMFNAEFKKRFESGLYKGIANY